MSSRKHHRLTKLKSLMADRSSLHIKDAADMLDVSEMTIRRDIHENTEQFEYFGGHIVPTDKHLRRTPYDLSVAADIHADEKRRACQHCLPYTQHRDIIFIDSGTTLAHLIDMLPDDSELTVVCYALNVADRTVRRPNLKLILVGGEYHSPSATFSGLGAEAIFSKLGISTGFFSAAGLNEKIGASCANFSETSQKRAAIANCQRKILVIDSSKIGKVCPARYADVDEFDLILTEDGPLEFPIAQA